MSRLPTKNQTQSTKNAPSSCLKLTRSIQIDTSSIQTSQKKLKKIPLFKEL